jgi:putative transposase
VSLARLSHADDRAPRRLTTLRPMARPLRLEHAGAIWHVTARGNRKEDIFVDDRDRRALLEHLAVTIEMYKWRVHAWVLMTNHYHLVLETPEPNLGRGMQRLNGPYAQGSNKRHGRVGHVFQGRYKAILVERESHLLELTRYVVLNPVRARMVERAEDYPWSSYRQTLGLVQGMDWLETGWTLLHFGRGMREARRRFREFVAEAAASDYHPWGRLTGQIYLGGEVFRERVDALLSTRPPAVEIPRPQRVLTPRPSLDQILGAVVVAFETTAKEVRLRRRGPARKAFALLARRSAAAPLREVGDLLGINPWSASHSASAGAMLEVEDPQFRRRLQSARSLVEKLATWQT